MANGRKKGNSTKTPREAATYRHPEAESPLRPDVGTQAQFKKRKPPVTYRYDSSLSPELEWDGQNPARETGEVGFDLFGDPGRSITDQVLKAYEYRDKWVNRMILGDSLVVMNSLLRYEGLGGQVQMIYIDPPYGVKFGSNFQPFVRKRDVSHNDDEDMTREPEMVKAYRDTWELGLHSYLTYLRDRLLLARELLTPTGSVFVQISDENLHHVRELMDEVFGAASCVAIIPFAKTASSTQELLPTVCDFVLWYAKDLERVKYHQLYLDKEVPSVRTRLLCRPDGACSAWTI